MSQIKGADFLSQIDDKNKLSYSMWTPEKTMIVLGRFSKEEENCTEFVYQDQLLIKKRLGGGGVVVLDKGCFVLDIAFKDQVKRNVSYYFLKFNEIIIRALSYFNIEAVSDEKWFDIKIGNKKIGGVTLFSRKREILYGCSLLIQNDIISKIEKYLKLPIKQPEYRNKRMHKDFLLSLDNFKNFSINDFKRVLNNEILKFKRSL